MRYNILNIQNKVLESGKLGSRYYVSNKYPEIPFNEDDIYVMSTQGDRYDLLAKTYYKDVNLWWIIPCANPEIGFDSLFIPEGYQIRIPINIQQIISDYNKLNRYE